MASGDSVPSSTTSRLRQNWVLGPVADFLLIIAAPVLGLVWAVATYHIAYRISVDGYQYSAEIAAGIENIITKTNSFEKMSLKFSLFKSERYFPTRGSILNSDKFFT